MPNIFFVQSVRFQKFFYCGKKKKHIRFTTYPFLSAQFSSIKYIYIAFFSIVKQTPELFHLAYLKL